MPKQAVKASGGTRVSPLKIAREIRIRKKSPLRSAPRRTLGCGNRPKTRADPRKVRKLREKSGHFRLKNDWVIGIIFGMKCEILNHYGIIFETKLN